MRLWGRGTAPRCEGEATKYLSGWVEAEARIRSTEGMRGYDGHDGTLEERLSTALIDDFLVQSQGRSIHPLDTSRAPAPPEALALFGSPRSSFRPYACLDPSSLSTCRQFLKDVQPLSSLFFVFPGAMHQVRLYFDLIEPPIAGGAPSRLLRSPSMFSNSI